MPSRRTKKRRSPAPDRDAHDAGGQQVADPVGEGVATGPAGGVLGVQVVLRVRPGLRARVVGVLQPPVGVGHRVAVQVVDEREALGIGVVGGLLVRHGRHPRTPAGCSLPMARAARCGGMGA